MPGRYRSDKKDQRRENRKSGEGYRDFVGIQYFDRWWIVAAFDLTVHKPPTFLSVPVCVFIFIQDGSFFSSLRIAELAAPPLVDISDDLRSRKYEQ